MAKHKHYDVIVAWAEGKPIQRRYTPTDLWIDYGAPDIAPLFKSAYEYRIKPETLRYRVALFRYNNYLAPCAVKDSSTADQWEKASNFVKWITDWIEVEV